MGRGEDPTFSIHYEFKVGLARIKSVTNLVSGNDSNSRKVQIRSSVTPDSFALACRHLSGETITETFLS